MSVLVTTILTSCATPFRLHLPHDLRAVGLDGFEADAELGGDFLAGQPVDDEIENLVFAGRESIEPLPHRLARFLLAAPRVVQFERFANLLQQDFVVERLLQELDGPVLSVRSPPWAHRRNR